MRQGDAASMSARRRTKRGRAAAASLALLVAVACRRSTPASRVTGSYVLERAGGSACTLQVGPASPDSVRVQLACDRGSPSHNQGYLNTRLLLRDDRGVFETSEHRRRCVLVFDFESSGVVVAQEGDDADCGFGFGVYVAGRYERRSTVVPPFDLWPEESTPPA